MKSAIAYFLDVHTRHGGFASPIGFDSTCNCTLAPKSCPNSAACLNAKVAQQKAVRYRQAHASLIKHVFIPYKKAALSHDFFLSGTAAAFFLACLGTCTCAACSARSLCHFPWCLQLHATPAPAPVFCLATDSSAPPRSPHSAPALLAELDQ